jgi:vacuolar-type H+-ATPase subunit H
MQAARAVFESMRTEVEQELAGAQDVKNSALDAQREAEKALKQANEIKAAARQKADELAAGAETGAHALAADSNKKAKKRIADAEAKAAKIEADAKTSAEETLRAARLDAERERKSLRAEAIQEIKSVKDAIEGLRVELDEELETQRILTHATRLNVVSSLVAGDATVVMEQRSEPTPGQEAEDAD